MTDAYNGQPIFYDCVRCSGGNGRSRRSAGSSNCRHESCKGAKKRAVDAGELLQPTASAASSLKCFKVKRVLGVSTCLHLNDDERRVGRAAADDDIYIQLRGGFGRSADEDTDDLVPDTRWVQLAELVNADMDASELNVLDKFAKALPKVLKEARKRIEEREEEE